jgi:hypothetical protein
MNMNVSKVTIQLLNIMILNKLVILPLIGPPWLQVLMPKAITAGDPLKVEKSPELLNQLCCAGYDICFVDFVSGEAYIESNGEVLYSPFSFNCMIH